jgi:hypothetical protein
MKPWLPCVLLAALASPPAAIPAALAATPSGRPAASAAAAPVEEAPETPAVPDLWDPYGRSRIPSSTPPEFRSGQYLADSVVLARVGNRVIRAGDFRTRYFEMPSDGRPKPDSLGRLEFLRVLMNKELMGLLAREVNPPLGFEQRAELRDATTTILQNTLYQRWVVDSLNITEDDLARVLPQFDEDVRIRRILFDDRATAEKLRRDLARGRVAWAAAVKLHSRAGDLEPDGDLGWFRRSQLQGVSALRIFELPAGGISEPLQDSQGFHLVQVTERRKSDPPPLRLMRRMLIRDLRESQSAPLVRRMYAQARQRAGLAYDSTQVAWVVEQFLPGVQRKNVPPGVPLRVANQAPRFSAADRARVIARMKDRAISLGEFLDAYSHVPAVFRRPIVSLEPFTYTFESLFLGPVLADMARDLGLEQDPLAVSLIEERREKYMVERVYADSVENHVRITEPMRRAEYDREVKAGELTMPLTVRFALIIRQTRAGADSVVAELKSGVPADTVVARDLARHGPGVSRMHEAEYGKPNSYATIVFEELKPGQSTVLGPDAENKFMVISVADRREERTYTYDEMISAVDDSARQVEADRLFQALLARHRPKHAETMRGDLVMKVNLVDPLLD